MSVGLHPFLPEEDEEFLYRVFCSTREEELGPLDWNEAQREAFLRMQFAAYRHHYRTDLSDADYQVILHDGCPAGIFIVARWKNEIRLADIALLPKHRNAGIGTTLVRSLVDEAEQVGKPVTVHVDKSNRALSFYRRLGFVQVEDVGMHYLMKWGGAPGPSQAQVGKY